MKGAAVLAFAVALSGCATPLERFHSALRALAGPETKSCGLVPLHESAEQPVSCALSSLASGTAFEVGFQLRGIDSQIWEGLALRKSGTPQYVRFDSSPNGNTLFGQSRVVVEPCLSPVISVTASGAISCAGVR